MQRFFDILLSSVAILLFSPILIFTSIILLVTGENKVIYLQKRVGYSGKLFNLIKFATMLENSPNSGTITFNHDPRILPFGSFLRKSKINELPQLFNIFLGDMSVIGPRPLTKQTFSYYSKDVKQLIVTLRPGLSGIGSIFFRNEQLLLKQGDYLKVYKTIIAPYKGKLEAWYSKNNNLLNYFKLIFATVIIIFFPKTDVLSFLFKNLPAKPSNLKLN
tara:strand:- start:18 stop:671 length:654 start_codon:yes stop_codon:yes gene_type:complete